MADLSMMITTTPDGDAILPAVKINPFAQSPFAPAYEALENMTSGYVVSSCLSVFFWDVLCHLRDDYHILTKHRITFPTFVYFASRLSTLWYLIGYTIIETTPVGHCSLAIRLATCPLVIAVPASQLLLFLHVRAIYASQRFVVWLFTFLWFSTFVSSIVVAVSVSGLSIGSSNFCTPVQVIHVNIGIITTPLINDSLLFVALVARIMGTSTRETVTSRWRDKLNTAFFGASTPRLAKALLQNGQQYFLATVINNLTSLILYAHSKNILLTFISVTIMNLMVSRLYRKTKLTRYEEFDVSFQQGRGLPTQPILFAQNSSSMEEPVVPESASVSLTGTAPSGEGLYNAGSPRGYSHESKT